MASNEKIVVKVDSDLEAIIPGFLQEKWQDINAIQAALAHEDFGAIKILDWAIR